VVALRLFLEEAAAAMDATLRQAAGSASIGRHGSTAAGFYLPTGALLLGGRESHPLLLEAAAEALAFLAGRQETTDRPLAAGELHLTNDAGCGGAGIEDLILATPILRDGRLVAFVALTASHAGLGRATLAPVDRARREGLILPWMRAGHLGRPQSETVSLLAANTDDPTEFREEFAAQTHALGLGRAAIEEALETSGADGLTALAEVAATGALRALQQILGRLEVRELVGRAAPFTVRVSHGKATVSVRIEGSGDASDAGVTPALARAAVRATMREILASESPTLAILGGLDTGLDVDFSSAASSEVRPTSEARFLGAQAIADAVRAAFAANLAHLTHAPDGGCLLLDLRGRREDGARYQARLGMPGGLGASVFGDGLTHGAIPFSPHRTRSIEEIERTLPVRILRSQILPDSAGPGQYHGGSAVRLELVLLEGRAEADMLIPRRAIGMQGGMRGSDACVLHVTPRDGTRETHGPSRVTIHLDAGDRLVIESAGGGGWGIPFQRSIMRLEEDLARGIVTPDQSRNRYGLVLKPGTLAKDDYLTYRVRHYLLSTLAVEDIIAGEELLDSSEIADPIQRPLQSGEHTTETKRRRQTKSACQDAVFRRRKRSFLAARNPVRVRWAVRTIRAPRSLDWIPAATDDRDAIRASRISWGNEKGARDPRDPSPFPSRGKVAMIYARRRICRSPRPTSPAPSRRIDAGSGTAAAPRERTSSIPNASFTTLLSTSIFRISLAARVKPTYRPIAPPSGMTSDSSRTSPTP
jgi:N-methylhydantoinase B